MPKSIDAKLQHFLSNLVSSKRHDPLEMLTENAVMEFLSSYDASNAARRKAGDRAILLWFRGFPDPR